MGDFLSNIVAESLSLRQVVRPRPVSLFEPARSTQALTLTPPAEEVPVYLQASPGQDEILKTEPVKSQFQREPDRQPLTPPEVSPPPPAGTLGYSPPRPPGQYRPINPDDREPDVPPPPGDESVGKSSSRVAAPRKSEQLGQPAEQAVPVPSTSMSMPKMPGNGISAVTESRSQASVAERSGLVSGDTPQDIPGQTPGSEPQPIIEIRPIIERLVNESPPIPDIRPEGNIQIGTQPRLTPQFERKERISGQPSPVPTIQVTIGRIEVRATPAAESSNKRPAAPKSVSLDEYLRQRNERGRR